MRSDRETVRKEHEYEAETIRRLNRDYRMRRENELETGRYDEPRSWIDRTRDEIAAWFGNTDAMRRRQWDEAAGDHTGHGPVRRVDADTRITEELNHRLTVDRELDATRVQVATHDGVVTLEGAVPTWSSAQRAEGLASAISGVKQVINNLLVA
jgi:osmotically-inducible protein OsmY